jgi:alpha-galactosidase/6-phospho-beta-glucosidase family protein
MEISMDMGVQWTTIKWNGKGQGHAIYHNEVKCQRSRIFNELQYLDKKESNQSTRTNEKNQREI